MQPEGVEGKMQGDHTIRIVVCHLVNMERK